MSNFSFLFHISMNIIKVNRIASDGMPLLVALHLGLFCLPMSHKKDARLIWVNHGRSVDSCLASMGFY